MGPPCKTIWKTLLGNWPFHVWAWQWSKHTVNAIKLEMIRKTHSRGLASPRAQTSTFLKQCGIILVNVFPCMCAPFKKLLHPYSYQNIKKWGPAQDFCTVLTAGSNSCHKWIKWHYCKTSGRALFILLIWANLWLLLFVCLFVFNLHKWHPQVRLSHSWGNHYVQDWWSGIPGHKM